MKKAPLIPVTLCVLAALSSCDFETTMFGEFNSPNDPRTSEYADYTIEAIAGIRSGESPENGTATDLRLSHVTDMDASGGYLYVVDSLHHRVIKIDETTGASSVIAGTGVPGYSGDGGPAASARLFAPTAILAWDDGTLFILDAMNNAVRKVSASGVMSTYADLAALTGEENDMWMQMDWNRGCMARLGDDVLVYHYSRIYKLSGAPGSVGASEYPIEDFAGDLNGDFNSFGVDEDGTLWISAWLHEPQQRVLGRILLGSTTVETLYTFDAGASDSIAFDGTGKVIVFKNDTTIAAYDPSTGLLTAQTDGNGGSIFCLNDSGVLYRFNHWLDGDQGIITKIAAPLASPSMFAGKTGLTPSGDDGDRIEPWHLALEETSGILYYTDRVASVIRSIDLATGQGAIVASGLPGSTRGISIGPDGEIAFSTTHDSDVYELTEGGSFTKIASASSYLADIAVAPNGAVFAASYSPGLLNAAIGSVSRVSGESTILKVGNGSSISYSDPDGGYASAIPLGTLSAICFGPDGTLYLVEEERRVLSVAPTGIVSRIAGGKALVPSPDFVWFDGFNLEQEFDEASNSGIESQPKGLAVGPDGSLYIAHEVDPLLRVNSAGQIEQLRFFLDGRTADFCATGVAVDSAGRLYLATRYHIIKATPRL